MHLQVYYVLSIFYGPWWESLLEISGAGHPHLHQRFVEVPGCSGGSIGGGCICFWVPTGTYGVHNIIQYSNMGVGMGGGGGGLGGPWSPQPNAIKQ